MQINQHAEQNHSEKYHKIIMIILCVITFVMLSSCSSVISHKSQKPDLIPEGKIYNVKGRNNYCNTNDNDKLVVKVRNQTNNDVFVPTKTTVKFSSGDLSTQTTPPMPGGSSFTHTFIFPRGCFNHDCSFTIEVDSDKDLDESHETNNVAEGICIG